MICTNCGKELSDQAHFCTYCGHPVSQTEEGQTIRIVERVCPACRKTGRNNQLFCDQCGTLLTEHELAKVVSTAQGAVLKQVKMASLYEGTPKLGVAKATGILRVYDDRIEFVKVLGSATGAAFGALGMAVAARTAKTDSVVTYYYRDLMSYRVGKYGVGFNTLVLTLQQGRTVSLIPPMPGSGDPKEIVSLIQYFKSN